MTSSLKPKKTPHVPQVNPSVDELGVPSTDTLQSLLYIQEGLAIIAQEAIGRLGRFDLQHMRQPRWLLCVALREKLHL